MSITFLIRFDTERGRTGPGNHNKKSSRCSLLVAYFIQPICVCFYRAYSPQIIDESYEGKLKIQVKTIYFERLLHFSSPKCSKKFFKQSRFLLKMTHEEGFFGSNPPPPLPPRFPEPSTPPPARISSMPSVGGVYFFWNYPLNMFSLEGVLVRSGLFIWSWVLI